MPQLFVRTDVWSLKTDDPVIAYYAKAVAAMMNKPASDPLSWSYQAAIHGTSATPQRPLWNQCQHASWYFPPWHRMYVYYFERIVRQHVIEAGGPENWALPYWNYSRPSPDNTLPEAFRNPENPDGSANPLYVSQRAQGINAGATLPASATTTQFALSRPLYTGVPEFGGDRSVPAQFSQWTGRLESTPHNAVHNVVGGPDGWMSDPLTAAQDPIFWLHHANIDRLWWVWNQDPAHTNPSDAPWRNQAFSFFDADGKRVSLTGREIEDIREQLGYTYDRAGAGPDRAAGRERVQVGWPDPWPERPQAPAAVSAGNEPDRELVGATERPTILTGDPVTVPVTVDERAARSLAAGPRAASRQHRVFLDIEDITADRNPGLVYGIYVDLPDHPADSDLAKHHVGNLAPFGVELASRPRGDEHAHGLSESIDITALLDRLAEEGTWQDGHQITVTMRPVTLEPPPGQPELAAELARTAHPGRPLTIGRISLRYA